MAMVGMHKVPMEVVGTVLHVADAAFLALEHLPGRSSPPVQGANASSGKEEEEAADATQLRAENLRLRAQLAENIKLLRGVCRVLDASHDCPPDLYEHLLAVVDDSCFLAKLETLQQETLATRDSSEPSSLDVSINVGGESSCWVWVTDKIPPESLEEVSELDDENYVIVSEENVVDGIANFIARCVLENPKAKILSPEDLHKAVKRTLGDLKHRHNLRSIWEAGKVIYALSTWGILLAGLYSNRGVIRVAVKGVGATAKVVAKML